VSDAAAGVTSDGFDASSYTGHRLFRSPVLHTSPALMRHLKSIVSAVVLLAAAACSDDSVTDSRTILGLQLALTPAADTLYLGGPQGTGSTGTVAASATAQGMPIAMPGHVFESGDSSVVAVTTANPTDTSAVVKALAVGTTTVAVRVNTLRATSTIVVLPYVKSVTVSASTSQALVGDTIVLTAKAFGWSGDTVPGQTFTFSSSSSAATVTADGRVVFSAPGTATITATSDDATATVALTALAREFIGGGASTISSGLDATCGLLPLGRTYCFGQAPLIGVAKDTSCFNDRTPGTTSCTLVPLQIAGQLQLTALTVGDSVACGLDAQGRGYCWGDQTYGQIGNGISQPGTSALPTRVTGPFTSVLTFAQISAGTTHACGLTSAGKAYCWGKDSTYQLGNTDNLIVNSSTPIPADTLITFKSIAAGRGHTCGLRTDGVAFCWGDNRNGQLGRGTFGDVSDSAKVVVGPAFAQISARGDNTCGLVADGSIYCWGANESGQTGQAPSAFVATPTQVAGTGYTAVSVGGLDTTANVSRASHVCALSGGNAVCWGANSYGQLGRGTYGAPSSTPVAITGRTFTAISAGTRTTCAVASDGAYCWGSSILGAVGNQVQALRILTPEKTATPQ
jgi:alpha-tubulin suppressor-like RCC1 family protein